MELLTNTTKKVFSSTTPRKIVELMRLGEAEPGQAPRLGIKTSEIRDAFYSFMGFTRLDTSDALRKAIARGVQESVFGYTSGTVPALGDDGKYQVAQDKTIFGRTIPDDEVDLDSGFIIMPIAIPPAPQPVVAGTGGKVNDGKGDPYETQGGSKTVEEPAGASKPVPQATKKDVTITIRGSRDQLFKAWPAVANLADKAGKASIQVSATSENGFDPSWLRNAVLEPLEEAEVLEEPKSSAE